MCKRDVLLLIAKEMHPYFESLTIIDALDLQTFFMDFDHDTSFKFILEDDSISLASKARIHFCSSKGQGYGWLLGHLSVRFTSHILLSP
jgi:hypothetical protein